MFVRATIFIIIFYLLVGFSGYISFSKVAKKFELILLRDPLKDSKDILMKIGIAFFGV